MGRTSKTFALILTIIISMSCLYLLAVQPVNAQTIVHKVSQTFEIGQGVYAGITNFDLQIGDNIEGSFSVSMLGPYKGVLTGSDTCYEFVKVWIIPPNASPPWGNAILSFTVTSNNSTDNFDFTAQEQGKYQMWASVGADDMFLIDAKNPIMTLSYEWIGNPIKVDILSPSSQIYDQSTVLLTFTTNRPMDRAVYSLDGANNVTLWDTGYPSANTTLTGLPYGEHSLTLYASDSWENIDSQTVSFTVESSKTIFLIAIAVLVLVVAVASVFIYRRHRKTALSKTAGEDIHG
jgi:hypothetical protein